MSTSANQRSQPAVSTRDSSKPPARSASKTTSAIMWLAFSLRRIAIFHIGSIAISSLLYCWAEFHPTRNEFFGELFDSVYWSVTTALTVGYGDISPKTIAGKLIFMVFSHLWIYVTAPLILTNFVTRVIPDPHKFQDGEQLWVFVILKWIAVAVLAIAKRHGVADDLAPIPDESEYGVKLERAPVTEA